MKVFVYILIVFSALIVIPQSFGHSDWLEKTTSNLRRFAGACKLTHPMGDAKAELVWMSTHLNELSQTLGKKLKARKTLSETDVQELRQIIILLREYNDNRLRDGFTDEEWEKMGKKLSQFSSLLDPEKEPEEIATAFRGLVDSEISWIRDRAALATEADFADRWKKKSKNWASNGSWSLRAGLNSKYSYRNSSPYRAEKDIYIEKLEDVARPVNELTKKLWLQEDELIKVTKTLKAAYEKEFGAPAEKELEKVTEEIEALGKKIAAQRIFKELLSSKELEEIFSYPAPKTERDNQFQLGEIFSFRAKLSYSLVNSEHKKLAEKWDSEDSFIVRGMDAQSRKGRLKWVLNHSDFGKELRSLDADPKLVERYKSGLLRQNDLLEKSQKVLSPEQTAIVDSLKKKLKATEDELKATKTFQVEQNKKLARDFGQRFEENKARYNPFFEHTNALDCFLLNLVYPNQNFDDLRY